ncbi:MAG: hypothetical protein ACJ72A_24700 [Nocardioidaceae bacterium]
MHKLPRRSVSALAMTVALLTAASTSTIHAEGVSPDGINLRAQWTNGGEAWLELEDRNAKPTICFIWDNDAPQDGDSIASRILTRAGTVVVDLGTGDQWIDGAAEGCEIPHDNRYRDVFAHPANYVLEFSVLENQGTPATGPVRSVPLERASG